MKVTNRAYMHDGTAVDFECEYGEQMERARALGDVWRVESALADDDGALRLADDALGSARIRYRFVFGLGSTVDTMTFDVGWHGRRDDAKAFKIASRHAKAVERELVSGTGEVFLMSCECSDQSEEG